MTDEALRPRRKLWPTSVGLTLALGVFGCFACRAYYDGWMTAYHSDPRIIELWQRRFYEDLGVCLAVGVASLALLIRLVLLHRKNRRVSHTMP